ncbi:MAG: hypothetical protein KBD10_02985 [Candidatus Pacebacteria bacterium]|nr:hypothetical protein [Candidatus Paceibacterota bacterium]
MRSKNFSLKKFTYLLAHVSIFIVFFWFGLLKVVGTSPAYDLVDALRAITIPWWPMESFFVVLGLVEMIIGVLFLFKKTEKLAIAILIPHMCTTFLPLIMLPDIAWQSIMTPTLPGQYIIKNIIIVALATSVVVGYGKKAN